MTGADGSFSLGQFWFLLYLLIISVVRVGIIALLKRFISEAEIAISFWLICALGLPLPIISEWLSIGGKSLVEYTYFFVLGYFVFSDEKIVSKAANNCWLLFSIGLAATILNMYLFIWADKERILLNTIAEYVSEWIMIIALIGLAKKHLNFSGKVLFIGTVLLSCFAAFVCCEVSIRIPFLCFLTGTKYNPSK